MRYRGLFVICVLVASMLLPAQSSAEDPDFVEKAKDICLSLRVTMPKGELKVTDNKLSTKYKECQTARDDYNACDSRAKIESRVCPCGDVTITGPNGRSCGGGISKCRADFKKQLAKCMQQIATESDLAIDLSVDQLMYLGVELGLPPGVQDLLDGTFRLDTPEDRDKAVELLRRAGMEDDDAIDAIGKLASGDEDRAKEATDLILNKLNLDPRLLDEQRLKPEEEDHPDVPDDWKYTGGVTLEAAPVGKAVSDLDRAAEVIKQKESGGRYGITTCTNVCVYGAYQVHQANVWKWTCEIGRCATPQQFLRDSELQDAVFKHKFGEYVARSGSYTTAAGMWHGGPGFNPNRSDALGTRTGAYMADFARKFGDPNFVPSTPNYALQGGGSPFAGANPFVSSSGGGYGASPSYQSSGYAQPAPQQYPSQQPPRPPVPVSSQILPQGGLQSSGSVSLPPAPAQPEASIIVQPKGVVRGNPLVVSWSTVGMSAANPCQIYLQVGGTNSFFARGNEGSRTFTTSATSTLGTWEFRLQCSSPTGTAFERNASVVVK